MQTLRKKNSPCKFKKEPTRFLGEGVSFKAKLIGILEVSEARGDRMCQAALADLKMAIRAAGEHKQRIAVQVSIDGLRLRDEKTGECLYHHPVHKISFIAQDMSDSRAFGYIFGSPDTGHRFFGIKTDKAANQVVIAMRDLFQVVFELKKKEIELTKQNIEQSAKFHISGIFVEPAPDTKGAAGTESCRLQRIRTASLDADKNSTNSGSNEKKNESQTGVIADLLDLQFELNSLQQGIHQLDKITPDNPRPSSEDPFESDPFGDSFANMKVTSNVQPILPPPPSSSKRAHLERQATIPATVSSLTSSPATVSSITLSPATHPALSSKTPPPQETVKWLENDSEKRFSDGEIASLTNNGSADEEKENGSLGIGSSQRRSPQIDVFTELDPLGTGLSKPYIDKKDFFQHLKNPPKKVLKDLVTTNSGETFPTNFDIAIDPLDPIKVRNEIGQKSSESFEDGDFANFEKFDNDNDRLPEVTIPSPPQQQQHQHNVATEKLDSPQQLNRSIQRTIHHQPLSVSLPPEESSVHHRACSLSNTATSTTVSSGITVINRIDIESADSIQSLMRLPSPKKYQSIKRRDHDMDLTSGGRRRESIDKPFPVDFSKSTESCSSEANSRLSSSSAELDIVPEPPPRGTASILINPPPLPPKKQAVRCGVGKPPPRPPYTDSQLHYDFIERVETSPSPTRREHTQSPAQIDIVKSRFDDNFSPSLSRMSDSQRGDDSASFGGASKFDPMIPTTLSNLFRNPYMGGSGDGKRVLNTPVTSTTSSFTTATTKPSLDITLSQLTSSNLAEFATSLDMSVTELTNLTLQQLTECLARLSAREVNGASGAQRNISSPAPTSTKLVETSFVSSEPLFKADFDNDTKINQQTQQLPEQPVYDKYAVFRELVEMEQMKEEISTNENVETTSQQSIESNGRNESKSTFSLDETNEVKDSISGVSDLMSNRDPSESALEPLQNRDTITNGKSIDRTEPIKEQSEDDRESKIARSQKSVQSPGSMCNEEKTKSLENFESERAQEKVQQTKTNLGTENQSKESQKIGARYDEEEADEDEEIDSLSIVRERSFSEDKPTSISVASPIERQTPKTIGDQDLLKLFAESSADAISPKKSVTREDEVRESTDIFEEIKMLNNAGSQSMGREDSNLSANMEKRKSFEGLDAERLSLQNKGQQGKTRIVIEGSGRIEECTGAEYDEEEAEEDEEIDAISNARDRSSSDEKPPSLTIASPIEQAQQAPKNLADHDLLKLFSESPSESLSPRKTGMRREDDSRSVTTDIFEEIRMLNSSSNQSMTINHQNKDSMRATSGFEDVFCPFVEAKHELKDGQESLTGSVKDEGNWAKFENTGVFHSDKSSYDDPASVGGTSPWSPDEKDFQVEGGRKATLKQQQQHRLHSGESDNEWKDEEESEESNGRRQFRDEGGFWYGRHPRMDLGDEAPYYDETGERSHFCERERGGRKFRGGMWSKQGSMHRGRDPSPWHEETSGSGRWSREEEDPQTQHGIHRGRYPSGRKQLSASYKDELEEQSKGYWKCRTKQRAWNGDRDSLRNPGQQPGHFVGEPIFYEDERAKKRMMLWSGERDDECDRDRFSSQESMGYEEEERWSRREYERRRGDKWEDEIGGSGSRFWPRRGPGDSTDLRSEYGPDRPVGVAGPPSQMSHEIYRKQHYCRGDSRDARDRSTGHEIYSSGVAGGSGGWLEDEYTLADRSDNSPRYLTRKRHWPKRPNSANDERNIGEPVYADPRIKYGMSRSECSDNDSELYHRPYRSRSRESYWGSDQEFESWTGAGSGSERLYWSEGPDAKSETLHRRRINRHKSNRPASQKNQSSPFEDDFAETLDRTEPSFDSFVIDASRGMMTNVEGKQPTTPRNVKEHLRKSDPRSSRYSKQPTPTRGSSYFENEGIPAETSPSERPRLHSDIKTTPENFPSDHSGKVAAATGETFVSDDNGRDAFFNGDPSPRFDDDAFAFKSEMADSVPETTAAASISIKNSRQIKYGNNKIKGDHDIKKSESVNIFVRESDPFDDDDFFK